MAGTEMVFFQLHEIRLEVLADLHALAAAGLELAACRGIGRRRNGAFQHHAIHLEIGIGNGNGRDQSLSIGMGGVGKDLLGGRIFHHAARYMTPTVSEICSTTDRSWEMNRYVMPNSFCRSRSRLMI